MDLVFNELSVQFDLPEDQKEAVLCLKKMHEILIKYRKAIKSPTANILSDQKFSEYSLVKDYSIDLKAIFRELPKDVRSMLTKAITSKPMLRDIPPFYSFVYNQQNEPEVKGFAYAYENDFYSISYNYSIWKEEEYELLRIADELEEKVKVKHFIESSTDELGDDSFYKSLRNSKELWDQIENVYPNLVFCGNTEQQICNTSLKDKRLRTAYRKLKVLNDGLEDNDIGSFEYKKLGITISGESESTLNLFSNERTFSIPKTDREEIFQLHIKSGDWRYHFFLDKEIKKCYIGYIGKHLRTAKYK